MQTRKFSLADQERRKETGKSHSIRRIEEGIDKLEYYIENLRIVEKD